MCFHLPQIWLQVKASDERFWLNISMGCFPFLSQHKSLGPFTKSGTTRLKKGVFVENSLLRDLRGGFGYTYMSTVHDTCLTSPTLMAQRYI